MNHFHAITVFERGTLVLGARHDFFVAFDSDQRVRQPQ
jgi:hypothetical protein